MFRLLRYFSIASLISMLAAAFALGALHWALERSHLLELGEKHNIGLTRAFTGIIWPPFRSYAASAVNLDGDALRNNPNFPRLDQSVRTAMRNTSTVKVKVIRLDGRILYSTDPDEIGSDYSNEAGYRKALKGEVYSEIEHHDRFVSLNGELTNCDTLSSYVALRHAPDEPIEGVLEIYTDITDVLASDEREEVYILVSAIAVLTVLYGILYLIVKRADSIIKSQHERQRRIEQSLRFATMHDALTELPNRVLLLDRIRQSITAAERRSNLLAIAYINLDNFKNINNSMGHQAGDKVLQAIAKRLTACLREGDTIARIGGDEFVVSLPDIQSNMNLYQISRKMLSAVSEPLVIQDRELHLTASIGITLYPEHGKDAETLIRKADIAMYSAKSLGRNRHQVYVENLNEQVQKQAHLEDEMWRALENNEFVLHYQPIIDLKTGSIIGAEALLRWPNLHGPWISPAEFIPLTEKCGLIVPLSEWVLSEACTQLQSWRERESGENELSMVINLSPRHFATPGLTTMMSDVIEQTNLDPRWLHLDITEELLVSMNESVLANFEGLKRLGIKFSFDDFGSGYSSLGYLRKFSIDMLKIDRSFTQGIPENADNAAIVTTIVELANSLGLTVVAKGVETDAQLAFLQQAGCQQAQGFLFSRPLPADEFLSLLQQKRDMRLTQSMIQFPHKDS